MDATCRISRPNCSLPALPGRSLRYENGNGEEIMLNDDDHFTLLNDEQISNKGWAPTSECKSYGLIDLLQIHFLWSFKFQTKVELYCLYSRPLIVLQHAFFCLNPMCVFSPWRRIPPPNRTKKKSNVTGRFPRLTRLPVSEVELPELHGSWLWQLWMIFVVQNKELRWWRLWKREIRWYYPEGDSDIPEPRGMFEGNFHLFPFGGICRWPGGSWRYDCKGDKQPKHIPNQWTSVGLRMHPSRWK